MFPAMRRLQAVRQASSVGLLSMRSTPSVVVSHRRWLADDATPSAGGIPSKLTLNLSSPTKMVCSQAQVDSVVLKATTGEFGVLPGHVPVVAQLQPSTISVTDGDKTDKYFVTGGFAYVNSDSTADVLTTDIFSHDELDHEEVKKSLAAAESELSGAKTEEEKAEAEIKVEVLSALNDSF